MITLVLVVIGLLLVATILGFVLIVVDSVRATKRAKQPRNR